MMIKGSRSDKGHNGAPYLANRATMLLAMQQKPSRKWKSSDKKKRLKTVEKLKKLDKGGVDPEELKNWGYEE